jgi:hypothetical protein
MMVGTPTAAAGKQVAAAAKPAGYLARDRTMPYIQMGFSKY